MARPSRFSPRSEDLDALEARTVSREDTCATMVSTTVASVTSGQARFDLVLGPRGAGKSHLLGLVEGRLRKALNGKAIVAALPEELHPSSLVHVLAEILRALPSDPEAGTLSRQLAILADCSPADAMDRAVGMIRARLQGLPLVIIIENLDVVFAAIGRQGQHQLRSILQTERSWSIVATSRSLSPAFSKESEPFYGTFVTRTLEPLSAEACREQLVRLAQANGREALARELGTPLGLARVQTLRHVLGSYPRAMAFVFPHLHHDEPEMVERALHELAEELTPYFQEQMGRLSLGQRPIAELLAEHWNPLSVGEIARATFNTPASTSTHLKYLREDAIVRATKLGREQYYELADPMFRIARAMKRNEIRAKTFLRVLQGWYEFREFDLWQLSPARMMEIGTPQDMADSYHANLFAPWIIKLEEGRYREALQGMETLDTDHLLLTIYRIIALSRLGEDERAFEAIRIRITRMRITVCGVAAGEKILPFRSDKPRRRLTNKGRSNLAGRFCATILSINNIVAHGGKGSLHSELIVVEEALCSSSPVVREIATHVLLDFVVPSLLVRAREYELAGKLIALLAPVGTEALSFNLAKVVLDSWAAGQLPKVFEGRIERSAPLARNLSPLARAGLLMAVHGERDHATTDAVKTAIKESLPRKSTANTIWMKIFFILILPHLPTIFDTSLLLDTHSPESRRVLAETVHEGILQWIAAGRDMSSIIPVLSFQEQMIADLGMSTPLVTSSDPDLAYVRLAAPERAAVRQFAQALGLEQRHADLCVLSPNEEP